MESNEIENKTGSYDFITEYKNAILKDIPTNENWAEDIGIVVLSMACSKVYFYTNVGKVNLNIWINATAPSGLGNKTAPLMEYGKPTIKELTKLNQADYLFPSSFNPESAVELLNKQSKGIIIKDELTRLLKESKAMQNGVPIEFLTHLYDGNVEKRYTITHGLRDLNEIYISLLGTTTDYLFKVMEQYNFIQGLGNRILWERYDMQREAIPVEKRYGANDDTYNARMVLIKGFAKFLYKIDKLEFLHVIADPNGNAAKLLANFDIELNNKVNSLPKDDIRRSYYDRMFLQTNKLAVLKSISTQLNNLKVSGDSELYEIQLQESDVVWAINKAHKFLQSFEDMIKEWDKSRVKKTDVMNEEDNFKAIKEAVESTPYGIACTKEILVRLHWAASGTTYDRSTQLIRSAALNDKYIHKLTEDEIRKLTDEECKSAGMKSRNVTALVYRKVS
jgi:hypothetical protein